MTKNSHPWEFTGVYLGHLNTSHSNALFFPGGSDGKESACNAGDTGDVGSVPGQEDPLAEGMATHSCILPWRTLWTEKPGGLQYIRSPRVGHDGRDLAQHIRPVKIFPRL